MRVVAGVALAVCAVTAWAAAPVNAVPSSTAGAQQRAIAGCPTFPSNNYWHADISSLPQDPRSDAWLRHMSPRSKLHPDFGPSYGAQPVPYGIPITVVNGKHRKVNVHFGYASESDRVRYPLGRDTHIEGGWKAHGDRHAIIVDKSSCTLYETWNTRKRSKGWTAGSGAVWDLRSNALRHDGWTSADAAGLPILPGLLRWAEVKAGKVDHAIRFTTDVTDRRYIWPARHEAGSVNNRNYPPMGARFRLKASYDLSGYGRNTRVILKGMQKYGLVLADNGSPWYFQGDASSKWPGRVISELKQVPARAFVAVDTSSMQVGANSGRVNN
ncbi:MAG TPA: hypothetical protein VMT88_04365 [Actinomycetes bacterium]|nr:hypothetical protein [Actinomycetes bacterium]